MHLPVVGRLARRERGDTMVEVLIAIAVVSLILGGAYVTTNRSLQATRAAQERSVALKLAESQIERLKGLMAENPSAVPLSGTFCIDSNSGLPVTTSGLNTGTGQPTGSFHAACAVNATGAPTDDEPVFRLSITRTGDLFVLTEAWINVRGQTADNLQLRYRVYE